MVIVAKKNENLNSKFNWDFSSTEVEYEITDIQFPKLKSIISKNPILNALKFDQERVKYESLDAMNFSNESVKKPLTDDDNTLNLVHGSQSNPKNTSFLSIKKTLLKQLGISEKKGSIATEEYYFNKSGENQYWDGGVINTTYVDKLKKRGRIKEFYKDNQYLVGYGNLVIPRITFSNLQLSPILIKTDIVIDETAFSSMIASLLKYLEGLVSVFQNGSEPNKPGYKLTIELEKLANNSQYKGQYLMQWKFYGNEWTKIQAEIARQGQVSFNWIIENIIYMLRASSSKHELFSNIWELNQYWTKNVIPKEAIDSFKMTKEVLFVKLWESETELTTLSDEFQDLLSSGESYFKFGPYKIFLFDDNLHFASKFVKIQSIVKG